MKTITEFSGFQIKEFSNKRQAWITEGKSEEELNTLTAETLKFEEAKLTLFKNAMNLIGKDADRVKRVIVATKDENEKPQDGFKEIEGHFFKLELFPAPQGQGRDKRDQRNSRNPKDKKGGRNDRKGKRGDFKDKNFGDRKFGPRKTESADGAANGAANSEQRADRPQRPDRKPRPFPNKKDGNRQGPRPPRNQGPKGAGELRLVLKGQAPQTFAGANPAQTTATAEAGSALAAETPSS